MVNYNCLIFSYAVGYMLLNLGLEWRGLGLLNLFIEVTTSACFEFRMNVG